LINYTTAYDYWIKIEKLDWAEAGIHLFSPITTHWRAVFMTSPAQYDIWIIQATRDAGPGVLLIAAALVLAAVLLGTQIKGRVASAARPPS
jgi:hypothetical protein